MKTYIILLLVQFFIFSPLLHSQDIPNFDPQSELNKSDQKFNPQISTNVDRTNINSEVASTQTLMAAKNAALKDPDAFAKKCIEDLKLSIDHDYDLPYVQSYALSEILNAHVIKDTTLVKELVVLAIANLDHLADYKEEEDNKGTLCKIQDNTNKYIQAGVNLFTQGYWQVKDDPIDAQSNMMILASACNGYGESYLDVDKSLANSKNLTTYKSTDGTYINLGVSGFGTVLRSKSKGIATIERFAERKDGYGQIGLETLFEMNSNEAINSLKKFESLNPYADGLNKQCVVDLDHSNDQKAEEQQAKVVYYLAKKQWPISRAELLAKVPEIKDNLSLFFKNVDEDYLFLKETITTSSVVTEGTIEKIKKVIETSGEMKKKEFETIMNSSTNKTSANTAATLLGKAEPYPNHKAYQFVGTIGNLLEYSMFLSKLPSSQFAADGSLLTEEIAPAITSSDLVPNTANMFLQTDGISAVSEFLPSTTAQTTTIVLEIPKAASTTEQVAQTWKIVSSDIMPSIDLAKALSYGIAGAQGVSDIMTLTTDDKTFLIDIKSKTIMSDLNTAKFNKAVQGLKAVTVTVTIPNSTVYTYTLWVTDLIKVQTLVNFIRSYSDLNDNVKVEINYPTTKVVSVEKPTTITAPTKEISAQMETKISNMLANSALSATDEAKFLNAFKSRTCLANTKSATTFAQQNTIFNTVEVFNAPSGATVLKITRGLSATDGAINFVTTFTYDVDGNILEASSIDNRERTAALSSDEAAELEDTISEYKQICTDL